MPAEWFIAIDGQQQGPYDLAALPTLGLQPTSLVWRQGMPDWLPAQNVPDLTPLLRAATPPEPQYYEDWRPGPTPPAAPSPSPTGNWQPATGNFPTPTYSPAATYPPLAGSHPHYPPAPTGNWQPATGNFRQGDRIAAGICAIFFGWAGVHKFILGLNRPAWIMLLGSIFTCGMAAFLFFFIGLAEGIIYLSKSDQDFYQSYVVERREWF